MGQKHRDAYFSLISKQQNPIRKECELRFSKSDIEADDAYIFVCDTIEKDDCKKLLALRTDFTDADAFWRLLKKAIVNNIVNTFSSKNKKRHVPAWVSKMGALYEAIYKRLCLKGQDIEKIVEDESKSVPGGRQKDFIHSIIHEIINKDPSCCEQGPQRDASDPDTFASEEEDFGPPEQVLIKREEEASIQAMRIFLDWYKPRKEDLDDVTCKNFFDALSENLHLSIEEKLFLRLIYQDGAMVESAGTMLGWSRDQSFRRRRELLGRIRNGIAIVQQQIGFIAHFDFF